MKSKGLLRKLFVNIGILEYVVWKMMRGETDSAFVQSLNLLFFCLFVISFVLNEPDF